MYLWVLPSGKFPLVQAVWGNTINPEVRDGCVETPSHTCCRSCAAPGGCGISTWCSWAQEGQALRARLGGGSVWAASFWTVCKQTRTHRFAGMSFIFNCATIGSLGCSSPDLWSQRCGANLAVCMHLRPHSFPQGLPELVATCPVVSHCRTRQAPGGACGYVSLESATLAFRLCISSVLCSHWAPSRPWTGRC